MATRMQQRRGTAAQWISTNAGAGPVLNSGEIGWESDTNKFKIGDGINNWSTLDYFIDGNSTANPAFGSSITFEGATANDFETTVAVTDPTADRTITLPDATGTVVLADGSGNITVSGNLTVSGTTTTINSTTINATTGIVFEGATANDFETTLTVTDPTADRTITFPDDGGTVQLRVTDVSDTEIGYLNGVTSAIQTQLDDKSTASKTETLTNKSISLGSNTVTSTLAQLNTAISDADVASIAGTETLTNKTLTSPVINTPTGITKTDVGLANVDNTTDALKPVSTATQTALDLKAPLTSPTFTGTVTLPSGTVTSTMILDGTIADADINASAAIAQSKIADLTTDLAAKAALSGATFTGAVSGTSLTLSGDLTVNGTTTNINSTNLVVEDKNVVLGDTTTPTDTTADGGGITLKGTTDKTFNWVDATDAWTSSEHINLASGKTLKYNGTDLIASQTGNSGKYLSTNGTSTSWETVSGYSAPTLGSTSIASGATVTTIAGLTLTTPTIGNIILGYTTTVTSAGTLVLTNTSNHTQILTGSSNHTVQMPLASTMTVGTRYLIKNNSTGSVSVVTNGGAASLATVTSGTSISVTSILNSGTTAASWDIQVSGFNTRTGSGSVVLGTAPTITNLSLSGYIMFGGTSGSAGQVLSTGGWIDPPGSGTVIGSGAASVSPSTQVIIGASAGNATNSPEVAIGNQAANSASFAASGTGVVIGAYAGYSSGGTNHILIGDSAGGYQSTNPLSGDIFIGTRTGLSYSRSGYENTVIGYEAGSQLTSGNRNTIIGYQAGIGGDSYTPTGTQSGSNNTVIGNSAKGSSTSVSNQITLGNSAITSLRCQVTSISGLSDERDKTNIEDLPIGIDFVNSLRPVKFEWDTRDESKVGVEDFGFIAQEVMEAEDAINSHDWLALTLRDNEERYELAPAKLVPILVKAIQDLSEEIKSLKNNNNLN